MTIDQRVEKHRRSIQAFNDRDLDRVVALYSDDIIVTDHAQQTTMKSREAIRGWNQAWIDAFSDGQIEILDCFGSGDVTVARFVGRGTNDGPMAGMEPTNQRVELHLCDVARWEGDEVVEDHLYYDLYGMLAQMGVVPPLPTS